MSRAVPWRDLAVLTAIALVVRAVGALLVPFPPHVDAAYYTMVAEQLATGNGFTAPALWSFLEVGGRLPPDPSLPVPSNGHWMPLTAIVAAAPMLLFGADWRAGQAVMVLLSTLLVPITYLAGWWIWESRRVALLSGVLAIAAGGLVLMYPLVESFAVFGVTGGLALLASIRAVDASRPGPWLVIAGLATGLAALARIDGSLLALAPATAWVMRRPLAREGALGGLGPALGWGLATVLAFGIVLAPWLLRNADVFGTPFPSPGNRMIWLRDYNEHLSVSLNLTPSRYFEWGALAIVGSKLRVLVELIGRTIALLGGIFGLYFLAGLWLERRNRRLTPFLVYVFAMFAVMVVVFTEHAPKGAFLHTAPAWLPIAIPLSVASVAPASGGLTRWWRFLGRERTHRFIEVAGAAGAVVLAVAGGIGLLEQWSVRQERHEAAAGFLGDAAAAGDVLLASDPSSLYLLTGLRGVATPFDPFPVLKQVVRAYGVDWVVVTLDPGRAGDPLGLWDGAAAIDSSGTSPTFLPEVPSFEAEGVRIYRVTPGN